MRARVQIAVATLSGNSVRQAVHTHRASVHQAAKLVIALPRVAGVTAGLAESNGSLPPGLWITSPAGWLSRTGISSGTLRSVMEYGLPFQYGRCVFLRHAVIHCFIAHAADKRWWRQRIIMIDVVYCVVLTDIGNESVPIQLAQCWFPALAISNVRI